MVQSRKAEIEAEIDHIVEAFTQTDGDLTAVQHQEMMRYAAAKFKGLDVDTAVSASLKPLLDKIALDAYKITDKDTDALLAQGYTEPELFEVVVAGSLGPGLASWQAGINAIDAYFADEATNAV